MANLAVRMRRLNTRLLDIRLGPGATVLQNNVSRIHLSFALKIDDGHRGARKFWRHYLPRLKYHNPAIPMTVERSEDQKGPASLTVFFSSPQSDHTKPKAEQVQPESSQIIDMKHRHESQILDDFLKLVDGKPVLATPEEELQLQELEEVRAISEADRLREQKIAEARKRNTVVLNR